MSMYPKAVFADGEEFELVGYSISEKVISLHGKEPVENREGFIIYDGSGGMIKDCSDFIYRWDVVDQRENEICYTDDPECRQIGPWADLSNAREQVEPLSNEELTEAVADLMYDVSMLQLGL